ncbi:DNA ligase [Sulfurimonas marina]|uniref:DNA ligase n=1 Tax=Sulfurimonas marina TaxID=2590551 RepID=A0A7M1AVK0_9BACT|nr:DNA ligase [Sulfurimonas marina]QOP41469.1 DNA ligase [Sulfurimonas marina]
MRYLYLLLLPLFLYAVKPELLLLQKYDESMDVSGWLMSEKLDGVRAYWDGEKLISRGGKEFFAPKEFTKDFPPFAIDGELWSKRDDFENISSITSQKTPHKGWKQITYNIFEVPYQKGGLLQRINILQNYLKTHPETTIRMIKQIKCKNKNHLRNFLKEVEEKGGEGVVIRELNAPYIAKRTNKSLKVKSFDDTECKVIGYKQGKGKYSQKVGSLTCQLENGKVIYLGSGLDDFQRENPPEIGTVVTFKYYGLTKNGIPRFPVFLRLRKQ